MMANYLASNDFTFVHPSATHLTGAPSTSVGYNLDFHGPQNVFSPINCTLPTTIQFPTPPVTSLPQNGGGSGSYLAEPANGTASSYNYACVTWQPPVNMNPLLSTCTEVSLPFVPQVSTPMPNGGFGTTSLWSHKPSSCAPPQVGGCKRKADEALPEDCWLPAKVRINEERMSACMSHLHLDNNNSGAQPNLESQPWYSQDIKTDADVAGVAELEELESVDFMPEPSSSGVSLGVNAKLAMNKNSKLELCRELELGLKTKEILPQVILDELVKSSMQVVLWKPPQECFGQQLFAEVLGETCKSEGGESLSVEEDEMASELSMSNLPTLKTCEDLMTCQPWAVPLETSSLTPDGIDLLDDCEDMDL